MKTFFLKKSSEDSEVDFQTSSSVEKSDVDCLTPGKQITKKTERLIEWNVEILGNLLKQVMAGRCPNKSAVVIPTSKLNLRLQSDSILDELQEIIELPAFSDKKTVEEIPSLPDEVHEQLLAFITEIASMYKLNP